MQEIKFNINHHVKVKLTGYGLDILRKHHESLAKQFPEVFGEFKEPKKDEDGYVRFQMWCLMERFGPYIHMGCKEQPFETNIILEVPKQTKYKIGDKVKMANDIGIIVQAIPSEHHHTVHWKKHKPHHCYGQ